MKFPSTAVFYMLFALLIVACKPKSVLNGSAAAGTEPKKEASPDAPHILFCQLMFYKANPVPKVSVLSLEAVPGVLNVKPNNAGPINYKFMDNSDKVIEEGNINNPLYFNAEDKDPATGKITGHMAYRDSAFKLIRIPYKKGISKLKISFTDSLKKEYTLTLTPVTIKKS